VVVVRVMSRIDDQTDERPKERSADSKGVTNTSEDTPQEHDAVSIREEKSDARKIVTGEAKYTADYAEEFPDLAEAAVLRSEIPHGTVTEIDTTQIEEIDGVCAVLTPDSEAVPDKQYTSAGQSYPEPSPRDLRVLRKHVRYVGDPIAAVAAEDRATARAAIRQIEVTYNEQEAVFDTEAAMSDDAPQIHDPEQIENVQPGADYERNIESRMVGEIGDVEAAFEKAASRTDRTVVETEWETPRQSHCVPEPHTAIASRDEDDRY
jgi:CO/xanthine dehydrogenase Mo-binding subunit